MLAGMKRAFTLPAVLAFPLAALLGLAALAGITVPDIYARENPLWAALGIGQDWVNLVVVAPVLVVCAAFALRGSRVSVLLLGGTLAYTAYSVVLYAFAMHFNSLFLVYAAALGIAFYGVLSFTVACSRQDLIAWFRPGLALSMAGGFSILLGVLFYLLWLSEVIPALAAHLTPKSVSDAGLITNPVQILDLGIVLPAFIFGGVALLRGKRIGYWLVPVMLSFGVLMDLALMGMAMSMAARGATQGPPAPVFGAMTVVSVAIVWPALRLQRLA